MKPCDLCNFPARIYCESDQANMCCDCDSKVHSANFLVAKHSRTLLCHVCQSHTPWIASGSKFGPTVSVCHNCANGCRREERVSGEANDDDDDDLDENEDDDEDENNNDDDEEEEEEDDDDDDDDEENQVVPWSSRPPQPVSSSSTSEESASRFCSSGEGESESKQAFSLKRMRENAELCSQPDGHGCSSSQQTHIHNESLSNKSAFFRLKNDPKTTETTGSGSKALIDSLKRLQHQSTVAGDDKSTTILGICKLSKATGVQW